MTPDSPKTLRKLRCMIKQSAAETSLADSQYDYGHVNGWIDALFCAAVISGETLYALRIEAAQAFELAMTSLHSLDTPLEG